MLKMINKDELYTTSTKIDEKDIVFLIKCLNEKDNDIRFNAFQILKHRSLDTEDVYRYFDVFALKLINKNSYQRSLGVMLIAANAKWDINNKINDIINSYLLVCEDEKPITSRQCLQSILQILPYKEELWDTITNKLLDINIENISKNMRKSTVIDIINVLKYINKEKQNKKIQEYFSNINNSTIFDAKEIKELNKAINND